MDCRPVAIIMSDQIHVMTVAQVVRKESKLYWWSFISLEYEFLVQNRGNIFAQFNLQRSRKAVIISVIIFWDIFWVQCKNLMLIGLPLNVFSIENALNRMPSLVIEPCPCRVKPHISVKHQDLN